MPPADLSMHACWGCSCGILFIIWGTSSFHRWPYIQRCGLICKSPVLNCGNAAQVFPDMLLSHIGDGNWVPSLFTMATPKNFSARKIPSAFMQSARLCRVDTVLISAASFLEGSAYFLSVGTRHNSEKSSREMLSPRRILHGSIFQRFKNDSEIQIESTWVLYRTVGGPVARARILSGSGSTAPSSVEEFGVGYVGREDIELQVGISDQHCFRIAQRVKSRLAVPTILPGTRKTWPQRSWKSALA